MAYNVVFVCTGNTCRSPMAEGFFNSLAMSAGLDAHAISCGLTAFVPMPVTALAAEAVKPYGVDISSHMSRQVSEGLLGMADTIYGMTDHHVDLLSRSFPAYAGKIRRLASVDIVDPFGGDVDEYAAVADVLHVAMSQLVNRLKRDADFHGSL